DLARARIEHRRRCVLGIPLPDSLGERLFGVCLNRVIDRHSDVASRNRRTVAQDVDRAARRVLDDRLVTGSSRELAIEPELESGKTAVVDADVPQYLRCDGPLWIRTPFLGVEPESPELQLLESGCAIRVGLAIEVDESVRPVRKLRVQGCRIEAERM